MSVMLLNLTDEGRLEIAAALGLLLLAAIIVIVLAGHALLGRDFMVRRST
jgi:ABC-type Fe3+ transport system permease subunit